MLDIELPLRDLIEIRSLIKRSITNYLDDHGWLEITPTTITSLTGSCETISTVFILPYFDRRAHLAQTAQLQLEQMVKDLKCRVWSYDHSFRAEPKVTARHLTEFSLFELEAPGFNLENIRFTQEEILRHCISEMLRNRKRLPEALHKRLDYLVSIDFPLRVVEYTDAVLTLQSLGKRVTIGDNLNMPEEVALLEHFQQKPFFLIRYPADIKYFNMRRSEDGRWVFSTDLIAPPFGEISGGSEREDEFNKVVSNLKSSQMWKDIELLGLDKDHFEWYLDLWKNGSPGPRGGFGIGFERLIGFLTGISDIRRCVEFIRNRECIFP